jgi:hypothetical protein
MWGARVAILKIERLPLQCDRLVVVDGEVVGKIADVFNV